MDDSLSLNNSLFGDHLSKRAWSKDTTDTQNYASYVYLDLYMYLEINSERTLKTNLFDKCDNDFTFLTVNFPLIGSNIPAVTAYGVYNSQLHPLTAKLALLY